MDDLHDYWRISRAGGRRMRVNRTYSLDYNTIQSLNERVSAKYRSKFVCDAIKTKLYGADEIDVSQLSSRRLMAILSQREDVREFVKKVLLVELKI